MSAAEGLLLLNPGVVVPSARVTRDVLALVRRVGFAKAAKLLQCHREAVARIAAGIPVRQGTLASAEKNLRDLDKAA